MRLNYRERQRRMKEVAEAGWQDIEALPESLRERFDHLPRMPIEIISCPLGKAVNQGGILRLAEAYRIERVTFAYEDDKANDFSGHRGAIRWQPYRWMMPLDALAEAKDRQKIALTLTESSVNFVDFEYKFPLSLVVGSEMEGIPEEVVEQCDATIAIPMYGLTRSLNVAIATAIVIHEIASRYVREAEFEPVREDSKRLTSRDRP